MRRWLMSVAVVGIAAGGCSSDSTKNTVPGFPAITGPAVVETTSRATKPASTPGDTIPAGPVDPGMELPAGANPVPSTAPTSTTAAGPTSTTAAAPPTIAAEPTSTTAAAPPTTAAGPTTPTFAPYASAIYSDPAHWICRGNSPGDVCGDPYPLTDVAADATLTPQPYTVAVDPPIDCFYVYPTSSGDKTFNSDLVPDSEIGVTRFQAARFNQVCKVYVPVYRSVTLAGLLGAADGNIATGWQIAYADVLDAWRYYLANDNDGRPVVIIAHSQGSFHVTRLLREEIDPNPSQRNLVVSAIIAGTSFQVAPGKDVGGDTKNMPLCRRNDQFGCVITFQSFRDDAPPLPGALFGKPGTDTESACTNPAALAGGPGVLKSAFPAGDWVLTKPGAAITTPMVDLPGLITAECKVKDGYSYLAITVNAVPADRRTDTIPGDGAPNWGLHTVDLNLTQESLIDIIRSQSGAYLAAR